MLTYLNRVSEGVSLSAEEAENAMNSILSGDATTSAIVAFLTALKAKGETAQELVGLARAMRRYAVFPVDGLPETLLDTCGTGGDSLGTINVSTIAAFVVAGADVPVAKHGNRSVSGRFGSADLMEALGVRVTMPVADAARAIREIGIGFLFAPHIHPAMKNAAPARAELKTRTVFNLLGPLTNPAGARIQVVGAPSPQSAALMADALAELSAVRGFIVHGSDGMDEITITGPSKIWPIGGEPFELTPEDFGVARASLDTLCGDPVVTAREVLSGRLGPARDIVLVNAAAALVAAGVAKNWKEGMAAAAESIDSGRAQAKLDALRAV